MRTPTRRLAALAAAALACAACSKLPPSSSAATTVAPTTTIPGASTPAQTKAADYRAQVTYLLVENVYLLSRVTQNVITTAPAGATSAAPSTSTTTSTSAPPTTAAATTPTTAAPNARPSGSTPVTTTTTTASPTSTTVAAAAPVQTTDDSGTALDANTHDLADLLSAPQGYGDSFSSAFSSLWTARNSDFAAYATAKAAKDSAAAQKATTALASNATDIATLFHGVNEYIAVNTVGATGLDDELTTDNSTITAFIDAQAAKDPTAVADVVTAAEQFRHTATVLAAAAAKLDPDQYPGTATGTAANLRASLTAALVDHVQLAGLTVDQLVTGAVGGPSMAALDANTSALANVVISNFGDPAGVQFSSQVWGPYVTALEGAARSKSGSGTAPDLSGVGAKVGTFFGSLAPQLSASTIGADMQRMVDALSAYVDASASGTQPVTQLRVATASVPKLGSDISEGIAESRPTQYLP
jgi:hypothetical protein